MGVVLPRRSRPAANLGQQQHAGIGVLAVTERRLLVVGRLACAERAREQGDTRPSPTSRACSTTCATRPSSPRATYRNMLDSAGRMVTVRVVLVPSISASRGSIPELYAHDGLNVDAIHRAGLAIRRGP